MKYRIAIKGLSLNSAYRGRRFATPALKTFKEALGYLLPNIRVPKGKLEVWYVFGVSSKNADGDNLQKCFQDAIAEQYDFNDKVIYRWHGEKVDVAKGSEFVQFEFTAYS